MVSFHVLRCAQCETFQVLQVTKSQKWKCKLCGQKQSVIKVYGEGTGAECRRHVQKLNTLRGEADQVIEDRRLNASNSSLDESTLGYNSADNQSCAINKAESRWSNFLDNQDNDEETELSGPTKMDSGLQGHVTTDWKEFTKRKRETRVECQKRKQFKASEQQAFRGANFKDNPGEMTRQAATTSNLRQSAPQRFPHKGSNFSTHNNNRLLSITHGSDNKGWESEEDGCENLSSVKRLLTSSLCGLDSTQDKCEKFSFSKSTLTSSLCGLDSKHSSLTISLTLPLKGEKLDSCQSMIKYPQQANQAKPKPLVQSKWSMFLNQDDSEEENSSDDAGEESTVFA